MDIHLPHETNINCVISNQINKFYFVATYALQPEDLLHLPLSSWENSGSAVQPQKLNLGGVGGRKHTVLQ